MQRDHGVSRGAIRTAVADLRPDYTAIEEDAPAPDGTDLTPTDAVVLATAALRSNDLNPFDLALWFSRSSS